MAETAKPWAPVLVSEQGNWKRNLIIILLFLNLFATISGGWATVFNTNQNETRSRDARPLLCALAVDDVLDNPLLNDAYKKANCPEELGPLDEVAG